MILAHSADNVEESEMQVAGSHRIDDLTVKNQGETAAIYVRPRKF